MENANMPDLTEKTLACERKYTGKIISVDLLDIELPDGRRAKREVIRHGNAVAVLARRGVASPAGRGADGSIVVKTAAAHHPVT